MNENSHKTYIMSDGIFFHNCEKQPLNFIISKVDLGFWRFIINSHEYHIYNCPFCGILLETNSANLKKLIRKAEYEIERQEIRMREHAERSKRYMDANWKQFEKFSFIATFLRIDTKFNPFSNEDSINYVFKPYTKIHFGTKPSSKQFLLNIVGNKEKLESLKLKKNDYVRIAGYFFQPKSDYERKSNRRLMFSLEAIEKINPKKLK